MLRVEGDGACCFHWLFWSSLLGFETTLSVFVGFDSDLSEAGVIGIGKVSLENLADCIPIDGDVPIYGLNDNEKCTGSVSIEVRWVELFNGKQSHAAGSSSSLSSKRPQGMSDDILQP